MYNNEGRWGGTRNPILGKSLSLSISLRFYEMDCRLKFVYEIYYTNIYFNRFRYGFMKWTVEYEYESILDF